jgi:hypothetical protein
MKDGRMGDGWDCESDLTGNRSKAMKFANVIGPFHSVHRTPMNPYIHK